jgi:hypothetical protein
MTGGRCGCIAATLFAPAPYVLAVLAGDYAHCSFEIACHSYAPTVGIVVGLLLAIGVGFAVKAVIDRFT